MVPASQRRRVACHHGEHREGGAGSRSIPLTDVSWRRGLLWGSARLATPHSLRPLRSGRGGGDRRRAHRACRRSGRLLPSGPRERRAPARRERGRVSLPHPHSRNLDAARAGDLDGDGSWEPLLPDSSYTALEAVVVRRAASRPPGGCRWATPSPPTSPALPTRRAALRWPQARRRES